MKKLLIALFIFSIFQIACEDDDRKKATMYDECCHELFSDTSNFKLFLPTAYSPDGDFLNDDYKVFVRDSSQNVRSITALKATNYKGNEVYSKDTMSTLDGIQNVWDFKGKNDELVLGTVKVEFTVTTLDSQTYTVKYSLCSYTCQSLNDNNVTIDFDKCWYEDQINFNTWFTHPTNEPRC